MSEIGSGERVVILSDRMSTSSPVGADQNTPETGRVLIFLDSARDLWSKDSAGVVKPLNGGTLSDASWEAVLPATDPTPIGDITHRGNAAVGLPLAGPILAGIRFQVVGDTAAQGSLYVGEMDESADVADHNQVFSDSVDHGLFAKPDSLPARRIDAPGLIRKTLPASETVRVPNGSQYLTYGSFSLGAGASIVLEGDADLVIL